MRKFIYSFLLTAFVCLSFLSNAFAEDRRTDKNTLSIMTFNAEFLWDGIAPEEGNSQVKFDWKGDVAKAAVHMQKIAEVIRRNDPDIINLVEVENLAALTLFNDKYLAGMNYKPYLVNGKDTFTGQDVAFLTRIDPENNQTFYDGRKGTSANVSKSVSKNYVARVQIGNYKIAFIGLHFLAIPLNEARRLDRQAQADAIKQIALEQIANGYSVVVWGDFNDYDVEDISLDLNNNKPISSVLANIRLLDRNTEIDDLVNVARYIEKSKRYTAWYDADKNGLIDMPGDYSSIDHILLSPELAGRIIETRIDQTHNPLEVSDHFPIIVKMKLASGLVPIVTNGGSGNPVTPSAGSSNPVNESTTSGNGSNSASNSNSTSNTSSNSNNTNTSGKKYFRGKRGGCYYLTASGRKSYVDRKICDDLGITYGDDNGGGQSTNNSSDSDSNTGTRSSDGRTYFKGSRGGCYYLTASGRKKYVDRSKCN